jgi:hypothetical protein
MPREKGRLISCLAARDTLTGATFAGAGCIDSQSPGQTPGEIDGGTVARWASMTPLRPRSAIAARIIPAGCLTSRLGRLMMTYSHASSIALAHVIVPQHIPKSGDYPGDKTGSRRGELWIP